MLLALADPAFRRINLKIIDKNALVCHLFSWCCCHLLYYTHILVGMYSKAAWGGPVDPFILTVFPNDTIKGDDDPIVSLVIFEWKDQDLIGVYPNPEAFSVRSIKYEACATIANIRSRKS
jgi:hypothetical protein